MIMSKVKFKVEFAPSACFAAYDEASDGVFPLHELSDSHAAGPAKALEGLRYGLVEVERACGPVLAGSTVTLSSVAGKLVARFEHDGVYWVLRELGTKAAGARYWAARCTEPEPFRMLPCRSYHAFRSLTSTYVAPDLRTPVTDRMVARWKREKGDIEGAAKFDARADVADFRRLLRWMAGFGLLANLAAREARERPVVPEEAFDPWNNRHFKREVVNDAR